MFLHNKNRLVILTIVIYNKNYESFQWNEIDDYWGVWICVYLSIASNIKNQFEIGLWFINHSTIVDHWWWTMPSHWVFLTKQWYLGFFSFQTKEDEKQKRSVKKKGLEPKFDLRNKNQKIEANASCQIWGCTTSCGSITRLAVETFEWRYPSAGGGDGVGVRRGGLIYTIVL